MARGFRRRRVLLGIAVAAALLPVAGLLYERSAEAADARRFPPPGRFVDVGGRRLHVVCIGQGPRAVLFEPAGFHNAMSNSVARASLAAQATVCSYDRVGAGWSEPGPETIPVDLLEADLGHVLDAVLPGRRVTIVASSIGGITAELFARRHPERVTGAVFADAATGALLAAAEPEVRSLWFSAARVGAPAAAQFGLIRLLDPMGIRPATAEVNARSAALTYRPGPWRTLAAMARGYDQTRAAFASAPAWTRSVPIVALSAEHARLPLVEGDETRRLRGLSKSAVQALARQSDAGTWRVVPGSDHLIASSRPQAVVDAVAEIEAADRRGGR